MLRYDTKPVHEMTRTELTEWLALYKTAMARAQPTDVAILLSKLAMHFWQADRPQEHYREIVADYLELLDYPLDIIAEGCKAWHRVGKPFFPKISELRDLMDPMFGRRVQLAGFITAEIERRDRATTGRTPHDIAEASDLMEQARRNLASGSDPKPVGQAAADVLKGYSEPETPQNRPVSHGSTDQEDPDGP